MKHRLGPHANERMTLVELEELAADVERVFHRFMEIRETYRI